MTEKLKYLLDTYAEWQAQKEFLQLRKAELMNEVQTPGDVKAAIDKQNESVKAINAQERARMEAIDQEVNAKLATIVIPDEIRQAYEEIQRQRELTEKYRRAKQDEIRQAYQSKRDAVIDSTQAEVSGAFSQMEARKRDIEAEFSGKNQDVEKNLKEMEAAIKNEAKQVGQTVKGKYYTAVFVKGRVTWNTDMLDGMIALVPQLEKARKEGEPSITLRKAA